MPSIKNSPWYDQSLISSATAIRSFLLSLVVCLGTTFPSITVAAITDSAPPIQDPFVNVIEKSKIKESVGHDLRDIGSKKLAILLSENAETHLKWSQNQMAGMSAFQRGMTSIFAPAGTIEQSDRIHQIVYNPKSVVNALIEPFVQRAKSVQIVADTQAFRDGGFDYMILLDVAFVNTFSYGFFVDKFEVGTYAAAYVIDPSANLVGKVQVGDTVPSKPNKFDFDLAEHRKLTYAKFSRALETLLGPVATRTNVSQTPEPQSALQAPSTKKSVAERLIELDQLIQRGLIRSDEAEAKRRKILEDF
jgi:hypothetical protein